MIYSLLILNIYCLVLNIYSLFHTQILHMQKDIVENYILLSSLLYFFSIVTCYIRFYILRTNYRIIVTSLKAQHNM